MSGNTKDLDARAAAGETVVEGERKRLSSSCGAASAKSTGTFADTLFHGEGSNLGG